MGQGSRPDRVAEGIRQELSRLLAGSVHDPGIGFVTITRVQVTPDLQVARVFYTTLGDDKQRRDTVRALGRAMPFLRRRIGQYLQLRRVPELHFQFDEGIAHQDRVERILIELEAERQHADEPPPDEPPTDEE